MNAAMRSAASSDKASGYGVAASIRRRLAPGYVDFFVLPDGIPGP